LPLSPDCLRWTASVTASSELSVLISISHPLKRILCRLGREHHLERLSLSLHENIRYAGKVCIRFFGNNCLPMSLQCKRLCPLPRKGRFQIESINPAFRHSETTVQDVATEPLSNNGRPIWLRYSGF
jgi:hypothetical protein